jgi:hypothetical protein
MEKELGDLAETNYRQSLESDSKNKSDVETAKSQSEKLPDFQKKGLVAKFREMLKETGKKRRRVALALGLAALTATGVVAYKSRESFVDVYKSYVSRLDDSVKPQKVVKETLKSGVTIKDGQSVKEKFIEVDKGDFPEGEFADPNERMGVYDNFGKFDPNLIREEDGPPKNLEGVNEKVTNGGEKSTPEIKQEAPAKKSKSVEEKKEAPVYPEIIAPGYDISEDWIISGDYLRRAPYIDVMVARDGLEFWNHHILGEHNGKMLGVLKQVYSGWRENLINEAKNWLARHPDAAREMGFPHSNINVIDVRREINVTMLNELLFQLAKQRNII